MTSEFVNGCIGGLIGIIISHPFDTIKTRIQSQTSNSFKSALLKGKLYNGLSYPLYGIMMEKSIVFGFYNLAREYNCNNFTSGLIGGFMSTVIVTPIDKMKILYQNNIINNQSNIIKNNTNIHKLQFNNKFNIIGELYKGFIPTIFRETPGFGIYFYTYNYLTEKYNNVNNMNKCKEKKDISLFKTFMFGGLSGFFSWIFIYPSDLIKTKYQSQNELKKNNIKIIETNKSNILISIIKDIWRENNTNNSIFLGIKNYYRGFYLAIMRAFPLHGGVFLGYEISKNILFLATI